MNCNSNVREVYIHLAPIWRGSFDDLAERLVRRHLAADLAGPSLTSLADLVGHFLAGNCLSHPIWRNLQSN